MEQIKIVIPRYIEELEMSASRRKKFFKRGDKNIPQKYLEYPERYKFKVMRGKEVLFDYGVGEPVIKNPVSYGTPNVKTIAGNEIYMMTHERVRMKIVGAIKDCFRPYLPKTLGINLPIMIDIELYCAPRYSNWDLDNMWIYNKVFQDLLVEQKLIPNDTIQYITKPGAPRYIPIIDHEERKMVFILTSDNDARIKSHVMYNLKPKSPIPGVWNHGFMLKTTNIGKPGDISIDMQGRKFFINTGKARFIPGAMIKALGRVYSQCIQLNENVSVATSFYLQYESYIKKELCDRGIQVIVYDE